MPPRVPVFAARLAVLLTPVTVLLIAGGCASTSSPTTNRTAPATRSSAVALRKALAFHASFDRATDADFALGDPWLYHAPALDRIREARPGLPADSVVQIEAGTGRHGGALRFAKPASPVIFFRVPDNLPWKATNWSGTVSFWLRTDFATLAPGYCDPVNITPRAWDDAAFFVEFEKRTNEVPFRLGAYADRKVWNPLNRDWGKMTAAEKPIVTVPGPPFSGERWTHVAFTWERFNTGRNDGVALLYLDGAQVGAIRGRNQTFTWNPAEARLHLGVGYVGSLDDLAIFNRALTMPEIQHVRSLPRGVRSLYAP